MRKREIQIHDCSDREKSNLVTTMLHLYGPRYGIFFSPDHEDADVIFSNDSFPEHIVATNKPLIKRQGRFGWQYMEMLGNKRHLDAIEIADHVVFDSKHSQEMLKHFSPNSRPKQESVIYSNADPSIFYPDTTKEVGTPRNWLAIADNWSKPENRYDLIVDFAYKVKGNLTVVGSNPRHVHEFPGNACSAGNVVYADLPELFRNADALITLAHRESNTDYVSMALASGIPVLYADSGAMKEVIGDAGISIKDYHYAHQPSIPTNFTIYYIEQIYKVFCDNYYKLRNNALMIDREARFEETLFGYFKLFLEFADLRQKRLREMDAMPF